MTESNLWLILFNADYSTSHELIVTNVLKTDDIDSRNKAVDHTRNAKGIYKYEMYKDTTNLAPPLMNHSYRTLCTIFMFLAYF